MVVEKASTRPNTKNNFKIAPKNVDGKLIAKNQTRLIIAMALNT